MRKKLTVLMLALLTFGVSAFAQSEVTGKIVDAKGEPLPGVDVLLKGASTGVISDVDGNYTIKGVNSKSVLVFSMIGFTSQEVEVGTQKTVNVTLTEDFALLDEVVVVGYGTARKKDISGAISSVNYSEDKNLTNLPNPNALSALSSKVAGFSYDPTSSASGDNTSSMTIRGKNAIPGSVSASSQSVNSPLLVIDGVLSSGSINQINTNDIQSIDVLKDASAAAIYGSRAANGVIIITTKKGTTDKPSVSFNGSVSLSTWGRMPQMVSDDETFLKNRFLSKKATSSAFTEKAWSDYSSLDEAASELLGTIEYQAYKEGIRTNWLDEISRTGVGQKYDVSVSGKTSTVNYYASANYFRQQGIRLGDDYQKYDFLAKMDVKVAKWLTIGFKANYLNGTSWGQTARIQNAQWMSPYSYTHALQEGYESWPNSAPDGGTISPLWGTGAGDSYLWTDKSSTSSNINGVGYAQIDFPFLKGLSYKFTAQGSRVSSLSDTFSNPEIWVNTNKVTDMDNPDQYAGQSAGASSESMSQFWNIDNILTYDRDFGNHHMDVMLGYTREYNNYEYLGTSFTGFESPTYLGVYTQDAAVDKTISRTRTESSAIGYLARANYNYKSRYYATFNFRRDGYSAFADGYKWGNFYGASAAWVLSNEKWFKNVKNVDFLKVRFSWGQNGSRSISPYQTLATVAAKTSNNGSITYTWLGGESAYGVAPQGIPNKTLTWATVEKFDLGIDFAFFGNRLSGALDLYKGSTKNMIVARSAPYMTGFSSIYDNVGLVTNNGVELTLHSVNFNGDGNNTFRWETDFVFDSNTNNVESLYGPDYDGNEADDVANAVAYGFDTYYALQVGHPIGSAYDIKKLGVFQSWDEIKAYTNADGEMIQPDAQPGDLKFEDYDGDGKITTADRHFLGSPDPLFTINLGNTLTWKNFSLYFNFRWAQGDSEHFLWYNPNAYGTTMTGGAQLADVKPWTTLNHTNEYARYGYSNTMNYLYWSDRSYLKLKDLSFAYTFNPKRIQKIGMSNLRLYVAATDLFCITGWKGMDPENAGVIAAGAASSRYGTNGTYKTVTFGVNITF